jgi:hypothetical protein
MPNEDRHRDRVVDPNTGIEFTFSDGANESDGKFLWDLYYHLQNKAAAMNMTIASQIKTQQGETITMPDLSNLKLVEESIEVADDAQYVDATEFGPPLPEAIYTFIQGKPEFKATDAGFLSAAMNHVVAGGDQDGKTFNFDRLSNKPFERQGVRVNMMTDHIRAVYGPNDRPSLRSHQDYANALEAAEGKPFKAQVSWEGGCDHAGTPHECSWTDATVFRVRGARNFPQNSNGQPLSEIKCPTCGTAVQARARINRRIAAS